MMFSMLVPMDPVQIYPYATLLLPASQNPLAITSTDTSDDTLRQPILLLGKKRAELSRKRNTDAEQLKGKRSTPALLS